jgi:hypothetical protein
MSEVPSAQVSIAPHAAQLTSQHAACASAAVSSSAEMCAASPRVAVPGLHGDWLAWSAQVHGAGRRKTAFIMAHAPVCVLFWPQVSPRTPQAASSSWP